MATETVKQKILQVGERLPDTATRDDAIGRRVGLLRRPSLQRYAAYAE